MLPNSPHCSNSSSAIGVGTCVVNTWLESRVVNPLNCTLFYLQNKYPNLTICSPEQIIRTYDNVINIAVDNGTRCLPACFRRETHIDMQMAQSITSITGSPEDYTFYLEFAFDNLQETIFQEVITTTVPGLIAEISGQFGLFLGISIFTMAHLGLLVLLAFNYLLRLCFKKSDV